MLRGQFSIGSTPSYVFPHKNKKSGWPFAVTSHIYVYLQKEMLQADLDDMTESNDDRMQEMQRNERELQAMQEELQAKEQAIQELAHKVIYQGLCVSP